MFHYIIFQKNLYIENYNKFGEINRTTVVVAVSLGVPLVYRYSHRYVPGT